MIDIPEAWAKSVEQVRARRWRKILVLGETDRGKSTYSRYLCEQLLERDPEANVAYVDADLGQKDIGPPAAITLGYPQRGLPWAQIDTAALYFVGNVTPVARLLPTVLGVQRLVDMARAQRTVINTLGFVRGVGRVLQTHLIEAIRPDAIIAIARGPELSALLKPYRYHPILRLPPSPQASAKSPEARQANRDRAFRHYFSAAQPIELRLQDLILQRLLLFTGAKIHFPPFPYAERTDEGVIVVAAKGLTVPPRVQVVPLGFEQHLLCGLSNRRQQGIGLGILQRIDYNRSALSLLTPVPAEHIRVLQFGDLYIGSDGRELGRRDTRVW